MDLRELGAECKQIRLLKSLKNNQFLNLTGEEVNVERPALE